MHALRHRRWGFALAFVAAYLLVLQSITGAFAAGLAVGSSSPHIDGTSLCITSEAPHDAPDEHRQLPECCTQACSMFAPTPAPVRQSAALAAPSRATSQEPRTLVEHKTWTDTRYGPANPRAPPTA